ncbi:MAG: LPS-assembly protein LptD [Pseudomonadales bacterium]|nr:LPS-assembly protein LptD [Pseudomonadales bacterium]
MTRLRAEAWAGAWVAAMLSGGLPAALAQASEDASVLDWVPLERLTEAQRATLSPVCCGLYIAPTFPEAETLEPGAILLRGTGIGAGDDGVVDVYQDLLVMQQSAVLEADRGRYDRNSQIFSLEERIRIRQPGILLTGNQASVDRGQGRSEIAGASYVLHGVSARGSADIIVYTDADGIITIDNGVFTRCEPGDNSWVIAGSRITLNRDQGRGTARNVTLRVGGIPALYLPWLSFPINDERATGFLAPLIGTTRRGGFDIAAPYYLNLAPNYDATITPRVQFNRGAMLGVEGRHRGQRSEQKLELSYLPDDQLYDPTQLDSPGYKGPPTPNRWWLDYNYRAALAERWSASINYSTVSDKNYFQDFGNNGFNITTLSYLYRDARVNYRSPHWNFQAATQGYQIIDPSVLPQNTPYRMLPRLNLNGDYLLGPNLLGSNLEFKLDSEYVAFDRGLAGTQEQIDKGAMVTGQRFSLTPSLSLPWSNAWSFVTPTLKYQHTQWRLQDQAADTSANPSRGIPTASLDGGLIFERDSKIFGKGYQQTLEPRLYYLYSQYKDQSQLPLFDTSDLTFSFNQLFRDDRFSGHDRVGDANQATLALTSRLYDEAGHEKARASVGQIQYFADRRVTLNRVPANYIPESLVSVDQRSSSLVSEASMQLSTAWQARSYIEYNPHDQKLVVGNFLFQYQSDINHILNFGYRFRDLPNPIAPNGLDRRIKQTDVSGIWPVNERWGMVGRWNYDISNQRNLETIAGVQYSNCCWNVRLVARQWIDNNALLYNVDRHNSGVFVQFELKGLGSVLGGNVNGILNNGITGYRDRDYVQ